MPSEAFAYDNVGNRNPVTFVYDNANRLMDDGTYTYTYDDNGSCITKTDKTNPTDVVTYTYDIENQLIAVSHQSSAISYAYDGLGRRIEKNVNGTITRYVYDNEDIIAEYDGSNTLQAKYLHGPGIDEPIRMERGGQKYFYHSDGLGSISALTDNTGTVVRTYRYDSFGNIVSQTGTVANPFTYTGREYDAETGLYYYRARYYDSRIGRFLQEDPIGYAGGLNLYAYVGNNSINFVDPYGLWVSIGEKPVAGYGSHTVIVLHPDNKAEFENDPRFYRNSQGEPEATISANPNWKSTSQSPFGNLTATPNFSQDRPENLRNSRRILDPLNRSDSQLIKDILNSANSYRNNLSYDPTPWLSDPYYNSNSYTYGILMNAGISNPPNLSGWQPGADKPIPLCK